MVLYPTVDSNTFIFTGPKVVRCTVAAFILKTCFCNPLLAHDALLKWARAFGSPQRDSSVSPANASDINLTTAMVGSGQGIMRKICEWLDRSSRFGPKESLVEILWPE